MILKQIFAFIVLSTGLAAAAELRLTVAGASEFAIKHNPALVAARLRIDEAKGRRYGVGRLSNPEIEVEHVQATSSAERASAIRLEQRFPITTRLRIEKLIADSQIAAARAEVRKVEWEIAGETQETVVRILALQKRVEIARGQASNSRELAAFLGQRISTGEVSSLDAAQADLEAQEVETEIVELRSQEAELFGKLRQQLGTNYSTRISLRDELFSLPQGTARARSERPDIAAAKAQAQTAVHEIGLAEANRWEDWTFRLSGEFEGSIDEPEGLEDDQFVGVGLKIPLPIWNDNRGQVKEAKASAKRAKAELSATHSLAANEAGSAMQQMQAFAELIQSFDGGLLAKAEQFEGLVKAAYDSGQTTLQEVLRSRERTLSIQQKRIDAMEKFQLARIRHASATGATFSDSKR